MMDSKFLASVRAGIFYFNWEKVLKQSLKNYFYCYNTQEYKYTPERAM